VKDYARWVVWLDYLDSERKRSQGRRIPLDSCVRSPTVEELVQACRRLDLDPQPEKAAYPRTPRRASGYVSIRKKGRKQDILMSVARELSKIRGSQPKKV